MLAGPGGNGGGGLVAARHLHDCGVTVTVTLSDPAPAGVPARQLAILRQMLVPVGEPPPADLVIDALIGYSLDGHPWGATADRIRWANNAPVPILALDVPSGLHPTTGQVGQPCIIADATLTLALPKAGLLHAPQVVGELFAADISVPSPVYHRLGRDVATAFDNRTIVRLPADSSAK